MYECPTLGLLITHIFSVTLLSISYVSINLNILIVQKPDGNKYCHSSFTTSHISKMPSLYLTFIFSSD